MSIPSLLSAITQGYSSSQIIQWLSSQSKKWAKQIKSSKSQGYADDQILEYLTHGKHTSKGQREQMLSGMTEQERATKILNQPTDLEPLAKGIGTAATLGASAYGISKIPSAIKSISGLLQRSPAAPGGPIGPQPMANAPTAPPQIAPVGGPAPISPGQNQNISAVPATQNQAQSPPQAPSQPPVNTPQVIQEMGIGPQIETLHRAGNGPDQISAALNTTLKPHQKKWLQDKIKAGEAKSLEEMIPEYLQQVPAQVQEQQNPINEITEEERKVVETPSGDIGEIKSQRNGKALVDVNGKLQQHKVDDLQSLYEKFKDVHVDVSKIPEAERSAPLYGIRTANDDKNLIVEFFPKNSDVADDEYEYFRKDGKPFEESTLHALQEGLTVPATSGTEWAGIWNEEDADSRGSANHHYIKMQAQDKNKVESGKESNDPSKSLWFIKKKSLFRHGFEREVRRQFGKHAKEFKREHQEKYGKKRKKPEEGR